MIILVSGLPGSGKSYFASRLAAGLGAQYINSDKTRKEMNRMGRYTFEDKRVVYERMAALTDEAMKRGSDVVVDATFYNLIFRKLFIGLAEQHNVPLRLIEVVAEEAIAKERLMRPRKYSEADYAVYQKIKSQFETFEEPHLILKSANLPVDRNIEIALDYIQGVHEGK